MPEETINPPQKPVCCFTFSSVIGILIAHYVTDQGTTENITERITAGLGWCITQSPDFQTLFRRLAYCP
jgi:hypothetical protein